MSLSPAAEPFPSGLETLGCAPGKAWQKEPISLGRGAGGRDPSPTQPLLQHSKQGLAHQGDLGTGRAPSRADLGDTAAFSREPRAFVNRSSNKHLSFHRWCSQFTAGTFKGHLGLVGAHGHKWDTRNAPGLQPQHLHFKEAPSAIHRSYFHRNISRNEEHQNDTTPLPAAPSLGQHSTRGLPGHSPSCTAPQLKITQNCEEHKKKSQSPEAELRDRCHSTSRAFGRSTNPKASPELPMATDPSSDCRAAPAPCTAAAQVPAVNTIRLDASFLTERSD